MLLHSQLCIFRFIFLPFFCRQREGDRLLSLSSLFAVKENWIERSVWVPDGSGTFWVARTVFYVYLCIHRESPLSPFTPWEKKKKMAKMSPQHNIPGLANMLARQYSILLWRSIKTVIQYALVTQMDSGTRLNLGEILVEYCRRGLSPQLSRQLLKMWKSLENFSSCRKSPKSATFFYCVWYKKSRFQTFVSFV